ncbi:hypothetical protein HDV04_004788 [Boothiomyces sp. JEL0838]|nr:hypothetical protein HDV04_004788 [Boothiomyces sp. JEL0838]
MEDQPIITHDHGNGVIVKKSSFLTEISKFKTVSGTRNKKYDESNQENPRPYQTELFHKAKESNILAILDTGSGKTMIALLLLRHMASLEPETGVKKCSIFLVPTIPLVSQQADYIEQNSPLKVKMFHGGTTSSCWDKQFWANEIQEYNVLVLTPAIFLYTLDKAYIRLSQVNLLVFDECHHARASHPYNLIMKLHYRTTVKEARPKIFGMTASPCVAKESTIEAIRQLEANLNANALSADSFSSLSNYVTRPTERIVYFGEGDFFEPPQLYLKLNEKYHDLLVLLQREIADCIAFSDTLGPWAADRALEFAIADLTYNLQRQISIKKKQEQAKEEEIQKNTQEMVIDDSNQETVKNDDSDGEKPNLEDGEIIDDQPDADLHFQEYRPELSLIENLSIEYLEIYHNYCIELAQDEKWGANADPPREDQLGGKVLKLFELLMEYKDEPECFCGIVFCQQRVMARVLQLIIEKYPKLDFIRSSYLLGHGGAKTNLYKRSSSMSVMVQKEIVNKFRNGLLNLLISTNVAEEGLDIKPCNCVIRFDMMDMNLINYIQSRGRARRKTSQFIIMANEGDDTAESMLQYLKLTEEGMRSVLKSDILPDDPASKFDETQDETIFKIASTGASITMYNSLALLYQYCTVLPRDKYYNPQPDFLFAEGANGVICEIRMPINIRKDCSKLRGAICSSRKDAKRDACFRMIKLLHSVGEIDDYLQPLRVAEIDETTGLIKHNTEKRRIGPKRKIRSFEAGIASFFRGVWSSEQIFYLNIVHMSVKDPTKVRFLSVGFLSFCPLPAETLEFPMKVNSYDTDFKVYTLEEPVTLSQSQITELQKYHYQFFKSVLRSEFEETEDWGTLCVPLIEEQLCGDTVNFDPRNLIDWEAIEYFKCIASEEEYISVCKDTKFEDIEHIVVYDKYRYKRHYLLTEIMKELNPNSIVKFDQTGREGTTLNAYKSNFDCQEEIDPNQVLLLAKPLGYPYQSKKRSPRFYGVYLIPQFGQISPIQSGHVKEALYYPLFLRLMMYDLMHGSPNSPSTLILNTSIDLLQKAFTCPSANLSYNYERLEFLGDAFLKVHLTLHLFVLNPNRHEGYLSQARVQLENNNNLRATANSYKLETFIMSFPFSRQHWIPPRLQGNMNQLLSDKTVADVFEATIGACYIHSGVPSAAACIKSFLGDGFYGNWSGYALKWSTYSMNSPNLDPAMIKSCQMVETKIGYKFKNISLLAQALTHSSAIVGQASYERLEFLGDSILGFVVTDFLLRLEQKMQPGALSDLRTELVNNQFLGVIACNLELPKYMNYLNVELASAISNWCKLFEGELKRHQANQPTNQLSDSVLFWNRLPSAPKTLGDLYETTAIADSKRDAKKSAAYLAVNYLKENMDENSKLAVCDCKIDPEEEKLERELNDQFIMIELWDDEDVREMAELDPEELLHFNGASLDYSLL